MTKSYPKLLNSIITILLILTLLNCYSVDRRYTYGKSETNYFKYTEKYPQFETGRPNIILDGLGHYIFSLLSKLILWDWKMNNHDISDKTKQYLIDYVKKNNLTDVKVRFNQFAPGGEFLRLWKNKNVNIVARATLGLINWLLYAALPGRLFAGLIGGDSYNPYTNTIHIYSDLPAVVLHEGAHAKDVASRKYKTGYVLSYLLPFVPLYFEARASSDALNYMAEINEPELIEESCKLLYPAYGTYVGGEIISIFMPEGFAELFVIPGHIYGRIKAYQLKKERNNSPSEIMTVN